ATATRGRRGSAQGRDRIITGPGRLVHGEGLTGNRQCSRARAATVVGGHRPSNGSTSGTTGRRAGQPAGGAAGRRPTASTPGSHVHSAAASTGIGICA